MRKLHILVQELVAVLLEIIQVDPNNAVEEVTIQFLPRASERVKIKTRKEWGSLHFFK